MLEDLEHTLNCVKKTLGICLYNFMEGGVNFAEMIAHSGTFDLPPSLGCVVCSRNNSVKLSLGDFERRRIIKLTA